MRSTYGNVRQNNVSVLYVRYREKITYGRTFGTTLSLHPTPSWPPAIGVSNSPLPPTLFFLVISHSVGYVILTYVIVRTDVYNKLTLCWSWLSWSRSMSVSLSRVFSCSSASEADKGDADDTARANKNISRNTWSFLTADSDIVDIAVFAWSQAHVASEADDSRPDNGVAAAELDTSQVGLINAPLRGMHLCNCIPVHRAVFLKFSFMIKLATNGLIINVDATALHSSMCFADLSVFTSLFEAAAKQDLFSRPIHSLRIFS